MRHSLSSKIPLTLLLPVALLFVGCDQYEYKLVELAPVEIGQDCTADDDSGGSMGFVPCCVDLQCYGLACPGVSANKLSVWTDASTPAHAGWWADFDNGTQPCP